MVPVHFFILFCTKHLGLKNQIIVKALPVEDIIRDLAHQWGMPIEEDGGEFTVLLPEELGEGYVRGTSFSSGVGVIQYKCTFYKEYEIHFSVLQIHPLKFMFCSRGLVHHTFEGETELHTIHTHQNVIVSSSGKKGHVITFKANQDCHLTSVEIVRSDFSTRENYSFKDLSPGLIPLFEDAESQKQFFYQGNYSLKASEIIESIEHKEYSGFLRSVLLEGKALQMLVLQIMQYKDDQREDGDTQIIRRSELKIIENATEILDRDLSKNYSVAELAKEVGTNVNKLQVGFRIMFGYTVNKYAQQQKLKVAKELLENSDFNISEIVNKIGLSNRSYFAKIFKEKYKVSPSYFQQNRSK